jgi:hypothetical protein
LRWQAIFVLFVTPKSKVKMMMTHQLEGTLPEEVLQLRITPEADSERFTSILRILLNEAM